MASTVKCRTEVGIDPRVARLRLRLVPKTDMSVNFGNWMRHRRAELGLTQPQVAKRLNAELPEMAADKQRVSDWERGYNMPSDIYKPAIVRALEVEDVSYFYRPFGEEPPDVLDTLKAPPDMATLIRRLDEQDEQLRLLRAELAVRDAEALARIEAVHRAIREIPSQRRR